MAADESVRALCVQGRPDEPPETPHSVGGEGLTEEGCQEGRAEAAGGAAESHGKGLARALPGESRGRGRRRVPRVPVGPDARAGARGQDVIHCVSLR